MESAIKFRNNPVEYLISVIKTTRINNTSAGIQKSFSDIQ